MADNIDSVIAAGAGGTDFQQLNSIMSIGNQAQQLKNAQLANQQGQITLQNSQATQQADQARTMAESESAQQHAQQEKLQTLQGHVTNGAKQMLSLHGTGATPDQVAKVVTDTMTNAGANQDAINQALSQIPTDKSQIDSFIVNKSQSALTLSDQINSKFPASNMLNTNQVQVPVAGGNQALTGIAPGTITGPATQNQVSPNQTIFNPKTQANELVGTTNAPKTLQTSPSLGQTETAQIPVLAMKTDWDSTQAAGSKAAQNIGVLQNIKQYAPGAVTGVGQDRRSFLAGLAGLVGIEPSQMEKTNTDLLAKNANMLALAGGDTNLAKTLAEVANPNVHMTKEAIIHASDQVIAQQKLAVAKQDYFGKLTDNPQSYSKELSAWNKIADPKVLQWNDMSIKEKSALKNSLTPSEQKNFKAGMQFFRQNGYMK